jgi:membrane-associated protein
VSAGRIVAAVAAVLLVCLAVWRLRTGRRGRAALALSLAAVLTFVASGQGGGLPGGDDAVDDLADALGGWILPFAALMAFLETAIPPVTLVFPGEWVILLIGAMADRGHLEIVPLVVVVWAFSALGDSFTFGLGRRFGRPFLIRYGRPIGLDHDRLDKVDRWFERYGAPTVCFGRLLPLLRPFGPFLAGASTLPYRRFVPWNVAGTLAFSLVFCLLGYGFSHSYDQVASTVGKVAFGALFLLAAGALAVYLRRRRRTEVSG